MTAGEVFADAFDRVRHGVHHAVSGLSPEELAFRPEAEANSIAWLVWHLTRVQDDHVAAAFDRPQLWTTEGWFERFGLPFAPEATGYGQRSEEVGAVRVSEDLLLGYHDAVDGVTHELVSGLEDGDLDRVVDEAWDPPVTLGVRLVSVVEDDLQHAGQAAYVRGLLGRR